MDTLERELFLEAMQERDAENERLRKMLTTAMRRAAATTQRSRS